MRDRRARAGKDSKARQIQRPDQRGFHQHGRERGCTQRKGATLARDEPEGLVGVPDILQHQRRPQRNRLAHAPLESCSMGDGRRRPDDVVSGQPEKLGHPERAVHLGIVAVPDTLGLGFGARGEDERGNVVAGGRRTRNLGFERSDRSPQFIKRTHPPVPRATQHEDMFKRGKLWPHARVHRRVIEIAVNLRDDCDFAPGEPQDVGQLACTVIVQ